VVVIIAKVIGDEHGGGDVDGIDVKTLKP